MSSFHFFLVNLLLLICLLLCSCAGPMNVAYDCSKPALVTDTHARNVARPNIQCQQPKNIVIMLDGTSNDWQTRTNVRRLYEIISNQDRPDIAIYYDEGVGSDFRKLTGGAFGFGFAENIRQAYRFIAYQHNPGDKIYIFGFSRGAATARALSGMIKFIGLLHRNTLEPFIMNPGENKFAAEEIGAESIFMTDPVYEAFDVYQTSHKAEFSSRLENLRIKYPSIKAEIPIRVVGVWDTVESLGFPILNRKKSAPDDNRYRIELHDNIDNAFQALAIDERRIPFQPLLWEDDDLQGNRPIREKNKLPPQKLEQVWFAGVHSDIGGGYGNSKDLSGITLNWMITKLESTNDYNLLPVKYRTHENPLGETHDSHKGVYSVTDEKVREELRCGQKIHKSVLQRIEHLKGTKNEYWPSQFNGKAIIYDMNHKDSCFIFVD